MKSKRNIITILLIVIAIIGISGWFIQNLQTKSSEKQQRVNEFEACKKAGFPVQESFPEKCVANGKSYLNPNQSVK